MGKMLFVDLTSGRIEEMDIDEGLARNFVGGYGIGARVIMERMREGVDPLSPENVLGFGTGPLTLSGAISTCRFHTMGKSPLTGFWGGANSGGNFANALKASGYDLVFFQGRAPRPVYVLITDGKVQIKEASHIWGKDTVRTEESIRKENGDDDLKIAAIGPAGERLSRISAIINDGGRAAARSGLGAVMGWKNLKALACKGNGRPELFDKKRVDELVKGLMEDMRQRPTHMYQVLSAFGTPGAVVPHLSTHDTPIKNWAGNNIEDFPQEKWPKVGWEGMEKYVQKKYACTGCPIACGGWVKVEGRYRVEKGHKPEYETLAAFGPMCLVDDMEALIYANELCNLYGFDTISAGATIAFAMECYEKGILSKSETDGIELTWGNADAMIKVLEKMGRREGIGDLLADGAKFAAERIGRGAEDCAMHVGGELVPMHDPRFAPGWGATYVSDPTPARHTRGGTQFLEVGALDPAVLSLWGLEEVPAKLDKYNPEGKGRIHALMVARQYLVETSGTCLFAADGLRFPFIEFLRAVTGFDVDPKELLKTGRRIATLLHAFNLREGFRPSNFRLPPRVAGNPPLRVGALKDITIDPEYLKRQYYEAMGFDYETGEIRKEVLKELGLEGLVG